MTKGTSTAANIIPIDAGAVRVQLKKQEDITALVDQSGAKKQVAYYTRQEQEPYSSFDIVLESTTGIGRILNSSGDVPRLSQSELYPVRHAFSPDHLTALRLLRVVVGRTERALMTLNDGDQITSDSEVQKVQVLLPELFCCRTLGDGFGTVINAAMSAFESRNGEPLNVVQLRAPNRVFKVLKDKPFMTVDEADQQVEQLEAAELNPYPPELVDFLSSGEGIR
jgi:hypothetical protein